MQRKRVSFLKRFSERKKAKKEYQRCIVLLEARARELMWCGEAKAEAKASWRIERKASRVKTRSVTLIRLEADVN